VLGVTADSQPSLPTYTAVYRGSTNRWEWEEVAAEQIGWENI